MEKQGPGELEAEDTNEWIDIYEDEIKNVAHRIVKVEDIISDVSKDN